jgi:hypothetical protein
VDQSRVRSNQSQATRRSRVISYVSVSLLFALVMSIPSSALGRETPYQRHTREHFRHAMPDSVRANHPAILPVARAIRSVTTNPLEQLVMVNDVTHLLVDYDDDDRVYNADEFHATLEEMLERRREAGWLYLRDDCDGRAVFAAHLLASLGIPWRLEASYWKEHAWIVARVNGVDYDLLDLRRNAPETNRLSYKLVGHMFVRPSVRPPLFAWRRAWAYRTNRDQDVGLALGLLTVDSTATRQKERYAMDWSQRSPSERLSPPDDRALSATIAGFPYGEPLRRGVVASVTSTRKAAPAPVLGSVSTSSPNSAAP